MQRDDVTTGIRAVVFDLGETLVSEERVWLGWARTLGVPATTFLAVLGAVIERRQHHLEVFRHFRGTDFDAEAERARLVATGEQPDIDVTDLYPDALPCLRRLKATGYVVGVAANQPAGVTERLCAALPADARPDLVGSSAAWGVLKPDPEFFARVAAEMAVPAQTIAYVGDRLDNDVLPARAAGLNAVFLRRGPWGHIHSTWPEVAQAHVRIDSLDELPDALR